ncbi:iron-containing redox enzyme family protein [Nostoc sp. FACHB-888]|uniref:iron-containing redox enzyme family protein n=1 Tax=Nostoc sp. FACHB-888 TaxID=2692842 RepID=UPI001685B9D2|nr:iron-containing redox enzyme family protein [Nostoc sp. FACHB-888]MBD2247489.1 iron-containing redox enzyme family protein [Nostoc sp. FACHB-888]
MLNHLYSLIHEPIKIAHQDRDSFINWSSAVAQRAFIENDQDAKLEVQRSLYNLYLGRLAVPWEKRAINVNHPLLAEIQFIFEESWYEAERLKHEPKLQSLPQVEDFPSWVQDYASNHYSNDLHPIFPFLAKEASLGQMREFFFQETPLEMLFGDIVGLMLPGLYGLPKMELVRNYWDEVGCGVDNRVHRNLRSQLMQYLGIPADAYISHADLLICEELELINLYLGLAVNRKKLAQLIGVMLTTELVIPGQFNYLIKGWKRLGISDEMLAYHLEHTTVDEVHAQDLLYRIVMPILKDAPHLMNDIVMGVSRRLDASGAVRDKLYDRIRNLSVDVNRNYALR